MNLLADEGVDRQIVERLRQTDHSVMYIAEMDPGIDDDEVLGLALENKALLLTTTRISASWCSDKSNWRLAGLSPGRKADIVSSAISQHSEELSNAFAVVTPGAIRIRRPDA